MTSEEQYQKNVETMWKIRLAAWKDKQARAFLTEKAGIFHGERIQAHNWDRAEREAWLEETKKSSM